MIFNEDCLTTMARLQSVDMIFADPPYNASNKPIRESKDTCLNAQFDSIDEDWDRIADYQIFSEAWITQAQRILKPGGAMYVCCSHHNLSHVLNECSLDLRNIIVWEDPMSVPSLTRRLFTLTAQFILFYTKGKNWTFNYHDLKAINPDRRKDGELKAMRDVWRICRANGKERLYKIDETGRRRATHPAQKPEELVKRCVIASTINGETVYDPFMGIGTTGMVCNKSGREFIGSEINADYYDIARGRLT